MAIAQLDHRVHRVFSVFVFSVSLLLLITNPLKADGSKYYALVIGNADYAVGELDNPLNDARDIGKTLDTLNFKVTLLLNAGHQEIKSAIQNFYQSVNTSRDVTVFYYAGHALQINNINYLLPIDVSYQSKSDLLDSSVNLNYLLSHLHQTKSESNIIILDACRNNPFSMVNTPAKARAVVAKADQSVKKTMNSSKGLAPIEAPPGTFIAYSTEPGRVAQDGDGRNGTYTKYLLKHMVNSVDVEAMFKKVRKDVMQETEHAQIPWEHSSLYSTFLFKKNDAKELPTIPSF